MFFRRSLQSDYGSVEDLRSFFMNTQVYLKKARQCFLHERPDVDPNPQIEEALRDLDSVVQRLSLSSTGSATD